MSESPRISIVDDDPSVRRALGRLCKSAGYEVDAYESAEAFLEDSGETPGCMILDVHLPGLSGLQLQENLNASKRWFPIIFMTAYEDDHIRAQAINAGAVQFLIKPLDSERLLDEIHGVLD